MLYFPKVSIAAHIIRHVAVEFNKANHGGGKSLPFNFVVEIKN